MLKGYFHCAAILLLLMFIIGGCAQKPAVIKGTVINEANEPLAGAAIFSVPQRYNALTDSIGNFNIEGVESGQYSLLAKYGNDSTLINIGLVEPGQVLITTIIIKKPQPPAPVTPPVAVLDTLLKPEPKKDTAAKSEPKETEFVDPIYSSKAKVLLLADKKFFKKFEVESSDNLVWELKSVNTPKISFENGKMYEGFFSGPNPRFFETAARRCFYDKKLWIYTHGPEPAPEGGREIYISIPLDMPANAGIDSVVVYYGFPKFPANADPGSVRFRMMGETTDGGITVLIDWESVDHSTNGKFYHKVIPTVADNRNIEYISLEINSDGDATWDDFLIRPLVYFSIQ